MTKRYCDVCGKELVPDPDITKPFIWWTVTIHAHSDTAIDVCNDCYISNYNSSASEVIDAYAKGWEHGADSALRQIIQTPKDTNIVRCKACKHWCCHDDVDYDQTEFTYYCETHKAFFNGNDFCSYGERSE